MAKMTVEVTEDEAALIREGLVMRANFVETGNPVLSATDAEQRKMKVKALTTDQMEFVVLLRRLAERFYPKV